MVKALIDSLVQVRDSIVHRFLRAKGYRSINNYVLKTLLILFGGSHQEKKSRSGEVCSIQGGQAIHRGIIAITWLSRVQCFVCQRRLVAAIARSKPKMSCLKHAALLHAVFLAGNLLQCFSFFSVLFELLKKKQAWLLNAIPYFEKSMVIK